MHIYTDGSCLGNPGPGGRAAIITGGNEKLRKGEKAPKELILSGGEPLTTNNAMELEAVTQALNKVAELEGIEPKEKEGMTGGLGLFSTQAGKITDIKIDLWTDSNYVKLGVNERMATWKRRNRRHAKGGKLIQNLDRRQRLDRLLEHFSNLHRHRVKGHAGHEFNERVDVLARTAAEKGMKN